MEQPIMQGDEDVPDSQEIEFENVTFGYGTNPVLNNISARFFSMHYDCDRWPVR